MIRAIGPSPRGRLFAQLRLDRFEVAAAAEPRRHIACGLEAQMLHAALSLRLPHLVVNDIYRRPRCSAV